MHIYFEIVNGPLSGQKKVLRSPSQMTFGRTGKADLAIPDDRLMSALHFRLVCDQNSCRVQDLGSTNGTHVNSRPVTDAELSNGDRITAGETTIEIYFDEVVTIPSSQGDNERSSPPIPVASIETSPIRPIENKPGARFGSKPDADRLPAIHLEITNGTYAGRMISIQRDQSVVFGNSESANQSIDDDDLLSLTHFVVETQQTGVRVRDLNSLRGTFVNGKRVSIAPLFDGDRIRAGNTEFLAHVAAEPICDIDVTWPPFATALADEDPLVVRQSLLAAVWTRQHWLLDFCRRRAAVPNPRESAILHLLAILGVPSDLNAIRKIARADYLGPQRFAILGSFGHPEIVDEVLPSMMDSDPATAVAAGQFFTRVTGYRFDSEQCIEFLCESKGVSLVPEPATSVVAFLPDSDRALGFWRSVKGTYYQGCRWCCGQDLSNGITNENYPRLDALALWENRLRSKFYGSAPIALAAFEKFPMLP